MAITKVSNSGFKSGMTKYDSFLAGNEAYDPAATWLISRTTLSSDTATVTFSSIPGTYKHLQVRINSKSARTSTPLTPIYVTINSDTGSNYARHLLYGDGTTAGTGANASTTSMYLGYEATSESTVNANTFGVSIIDFHDYASTSKYKTIRSLCGADTNGNGQIRLTSGLWMSTSAITSISFSDTVDNFKSGSTFALYGFTG